MINLGDYLSIQTLSLGIEKYKDTIIKLLNEIIQPKGIYERNDVAVREREGLEQKKGIIGEPFDTNVEILENGIRIMVDMANGQKTVIFLTKEKNRAAIEKLVTGGRVLDTFSHTGGLCTSRRSIMVLPK